VFLVLGFVFVSGIFWLSSNILFHLHVVWCCAVLCCGSCIVLFWYWLFWMWLFWCLLKRYWIGVSKIWFMVII